jgi:hypothetical protein
VIAKPEHLPYTPDKRVMLKIKHQRTAECVVAGFRWYKGGKGTLVGSLLLGLYDAEGVLHHVGVCSSFKREERAALAEKLGALRDGARETHPWRDWAVFADQDAPQRLPGAASRWNRGKDLSWEPIQRKAMSPSMINSLRWSRWFTDQPALAVSGLTGLNSSTLMPASLRRVKNARGVPRVPTLSRIRLTCTPASCLAIRASAKRWPTSSSSRM